MIGLSSSIRDLMSGLGVDIIEGDTPVDGSGDSSVDSSGDIQSVESILGHSLDGDSKGSLTSSGGDLGNQGSISASVVETSSSDELGANSDGKGSSSSEGTEEGSAVGGSADAGSADAGSDAGTDAGSDAGTIEDSEESSEGDSEDSAEDSDADSVEGSDESEDSDDAEEGSTDKGSSSAVASSGVKDSLGGVSSLAESMSVEDIDNFLKGVHFKRKLVDIPVSSIVLSEQSKVLRSSTAIGLTASIRDIGMVLNPIDVMELPKTSDDDESLYTMVSGTRRLYGAIRCNHKTIPAWVWDFSEKDKANKLSFLLGLVINKQQEHTMQEVWEAMKVLEHEYNLKPAQIEMLFPNLGNGDAMKLKDVALGEFKEPLDLLFSGEGTLDKAYKLLQKMRKESDTLEVEDSQGIISSTEAGNDAGITSDSEEEEAPLAHNEVMEILEMDNSDGLDDDTLFDSGVDKGHVQDRKGDGDDDLAPETKDMIKKRDKMLCRVCCSACDFKKKPSDEGYLNPREVHIAEAKKDVASAFISMLTVHHLIPVHAGGTDDPDNLITLCINCHHRLHVMEKMRGFIATKEDFEEWDDVTKHDAIGAYYFAKFAIEAGKRKGYSRKEAQDLASKSLKHKMPAQTVNEDKAIIKSLGKSVK